MLWQWITFGKGFNKGMDLYYKHNYQQAMIEFNHVLQISRNDFLVNFWLLRTTIKLNLINEVEKYTMICLELRPDLKELITLTQSYLEYTDDFTKSEIDEKIDILLNKYQSERNYSGKEILKILGVTTLCVIVLAIILVFLSDIWKVKLQIKKNPNLSMMGNYIPLIPVIYFYYSKPQLIRNVGIGLIDSYYRLKNKTFLFFCLGIIIWNCFWGGVMYFGVELYNIKVYRLEETIWTFLMGIFLVPFCEEALFRGIIFNYIKKYGRLLALWVTAFLFYFFHGVEAQFVQLLLSFYFILAYERFKTLLAPIILHFLQNLIVPTIWVLINSL